LADYDIVGKRVARVDGIAKVTGAAQYTADLSMPGQLYGKILRSPYPHARILSIDTSQAEKLYGVRGVVTGKDFGGFRYGFMPTTRDEPPLAEDKVRFVGEEVAAVAAIDPEIAAEAIELIKVEYEPLPAIYDPEASLEEGAPQLHADKPNNVSARVNMNFGDVEAALASAYYVREDRFYSQSVLHGFLEPHAVIARWDSDKALTIWASKQSPYFVYRNLASFFRMPLSRIRVIQPYIGGGFGGKNATFALDYCAALLAKKTGLPVKFVYEAEDILGYGRRRHPMTIYLTTGVTRDGLLLGSKCRLIADGGGYTSVGPMALYLAGTFMTLPYKLPSFKYEGVRAYTNKPVCNAMRGHGLPQIRYAAECQLELIAHDLSIDPIEIRRRNSVEPGHVTANKMHVSSCGMKDSMEQAVKASKWDLLKQEIYEHNMKGGRTLRGLGVACNAFGSGARLHGHTACGAVVKVHEDGGVSLLTGSTDSGQGSETVLGMITAELLGIPLEDIEVSRVDTLSTPIDPGSYGSRVTSTAGNAVKLATLEARKKLAEVAAKTLGGDIDDVIFKQGKVFLKNKPEKTIPFRKLCRLTYTHGYGHVIVGEGHWSQEIDMPNWETGEGDVAGTYSFGTQIAEVEVDRLTGKVKLVQMVVAHDLGYAINPLGCEGQHEGSIFGGMGHCMFEECQLEDGKTMNPSFLDYKMPTAMDMPRIMESIGIETIDQEGVFGAKESAEGTQVSTVPAIVNAIYNATGVMFKELPITPEKVLKALKEQNKSAGRDSNA
jgi:4-hydroxybenzoyl-CoA reductase alpha subunit